MGFLHIGESASELHTVGHVKLGWLWGGLGFYKVSVKEDKVICVVGFHLKKKVLFNLKELFLIRDLLFGGLSSENIEYNLVQTFMCKQSNEVPSRLQNLYV